jgi:hypothetical protein
MRVCQFRHFGTGEVQRERLDEQQFLDYFAAKIVSNVARQAAAGISSMQRHLQSILFPRFFTCYD